ncbi:MAG: general secretion pathway protein GspK, partial [Deltaproteobacteria bacterium]|nr:general secretion pathway protein GspK [Deltaproteobacteria bacterium]
RISDSKQLVSNLYAYLTPSNETPQPPGPGFPTGIRAPSQEQGAEGGSRNEPQRITRVQQLTEVPGFTAKHVQMVKPYLHEGRDSQINLNVASARVLRALPQLAEHVENIIEVREGEDGPFTNVSDLARANVSKEAQGAAIKFLTIKSDQFEVIAKVEYGNQATYFISAQLARVGTGIKETPMRIESLVLY